MSNNKKSPEKKRRSPHRPTSRLSDGEEARPISTPRSTAGKGRRGNRLKTPVSEPPFESISNWKPSDKVKSPRTPKRSRVRDEGRKGSRSPVQLGKTKPTSKIEKHTSQTPASSPSPPKLPLTVDKDRKRDRKRDKALSRTPISSEAIIDKKKVIANTDPNRKRSSPKPYVARASSPESPTTSVALAGKPQKIRKDRRQKKHNTSDVISKYQSAVAIQHSSPSKVEPPNPKQSTIRKDNLKKKKKDHPTIPSKQDHPNKISKRRDTPRSTHSPMTSQSVIYDNQEPRKRNQSPPPLRSPISKKPQPTATILDEPLFKTSIVHLTADQSVFNLQVDPVYNFETKRIAMTSCAKLLDENPVPKCLFGWERVPIQNASDPSCVVFVDHFMSGGHSKPKTLDSSQALVPQKSSHSPTSNERNTRGNRRRQSLESVNLGIEPKPSGVQSPAGKYPSKYPSKLEQSPTSSEPEQPKVTRSMPQTSSPHYNFQPGWQQYIHFSGGDPTNENRRLFWYHKSSKVLPLNT